jgi:hypothetical protein
MSLRKTAAFAASAALALGVSACGDDEKSTGSGGTAAAAEKTPPKPAAQIDQLSGKQTAVKLDAGFVEALTSLKVAPGAVGDGKITKGGSAIFPITGGNVTYYEPGTVSPFVQGMIDHEGSGLSLTAGGKKVELVDFVVDPGKSVLTGTVMLDGKEAAPAGTPLFFLDGRTLEPLEAKDNGTAVLQGTTVKLKQEAAELLNTTFEIDALEAGLEIGVATITVNTK